MLNNDDTTLIMFDKRTYNVGYALKNDDTMFVMLKKV